MKIFLKYLKPYILQCILAPAFKMLEALFELFVPLVMARLIDNGINNNDKDYIIREGLILALLALIGLLLSLTAQYFAAVSAMNFGKEVRLSLFRHIEELSFDDIDRLGTSTLITRMTGDINQMQTGVNMILRLFLRSPFIVFGALIMAFTVNKDAAMIFILILPILFIIVFGIIYSSIPMYKKVQGRSDEVTLRTRESLSGVRVIRAFGKQQSESAQFSGISRGLMNLQILVGRVAALLNPVTFIIINLGIILLIRRGALQVSSGNMTQGDLTALINYLSQILVELIKLANLIITISKMAASARRVSDVLSLKPSQTFPVKSPDLSGSITSIEMKDVSVRYGMSKDTALSGITFKAEKGETVGIIGGTGSGKSTLVSLIPRLYDAESGEVLINGINVKDISLSDVRGITSIVPQKSALFEGTIRDNMKVGKEDATDAEIENALRKACAWDFVNEKEGGISFSIEQGSKNLSGGQRQRLCIARGLLKDASILILDDSTSALDYATEAAVRRGLAEGKEERITIIVSQRLGLIRSADKIIVLDKGRILGIGTDKALMESCPLYRDIVNAQISREEAAV